MRRAAEVQLVVRPRPRGESKQRWLYSEIRGAILGSRLAGGARLPATRDFARQLGLARGTVLAVFDQLRAEGYLEATTGSGTFVAADLPDRRPDGPTAGRRASPALRAPALSRCGRVLATTPFPTTGRSWRAPAFRPNQPDAGAFPVELWNRIAARRSRLARRNLLADADALGSMSLREVIARHLREARGIACDGHHVAVVGSVQQALDLLARLLLDPGDAAWMEDPGYPGARGVLSATGAQVVPVPVDGDGVDVEAGRRLAMGARLAYVTAGRQSPLGMPLALDRRLALLAWAEDADAVVVEDDYDSEFRFHGAPLAALKSHDAGDRVAYLGTFSKMLFPGLRLAFAVLPDGLVDPFRGAVSLTGRFQPPATQAVLHEFIAEGHFARHLRRMRLHYAERADALTRAVGHYLGGALNLPPITTGLDAPAFLPPGSDDAAIARMAAEAGLEVRPLSYYAGARPAPPGLLLGFAAVPPAAIEAGAAALARVIARCPSA